MAEWILTGRSLGGKGCVQAPPPPTADFSVPPRRLLHPFIQLASKAQRLGGVARFQLLRCLSLRQEKSSTSPLVFCWGSGDETGLNTDMAREADFSVNLWNM